MRDVSSTTEVPLAGGGVTYTPPSGEVLRVFGCDNPTLPSDREVQSSFR